MASWLNAKLVSYASSDHLLEIEVGLKDVINESEERGLGMVDVIFSKSIRCIEYIDLLINKGDVRFVCLNGDTNREEKCNIPEQGEPGNYTVSQKSTVAFLQ